MTSSEQNSEWLTRKRLIDPKLKAAGWDIVPFMPGTSLASHQNPRSRSLRPQTFLPTLPSVQIAQSWSFGPQGVLTLKNAAAIGLEQPNQILFLQRPMVLIMGDSIPGAISMCVWLRDALAR